MKQHHLLSLLQKDFTTIHVAFRSDIDAAQEAKPVAFDTTRTTRKTEPRTFTYKAPLSEDVKADDFVVVEGPKGGPMVGLVMKVDEFPVIDPDADFVYKWIVQKVDKRGYEARVAQEKAFLETMKAVEIEAQRAELVKKMADHLPEGSDARKKYDAAVAMAMTPVQISNTATSKPEVAG